MRFSKEEIEAIIKQRVNFLESEVLKTKNEEFSFPLIHDIFSSKFGKNLEEKCRDLTGFTELSMLSISIVNKSKKLKTFSRKLFDEGLKMSLEEDEDSDVRKMAEALIPIKSLLFSKNSSDSNDKTPDVLSKKGMQKMKVTQRCSAYYIFAFYAYIDVYLDELYKNYFKKKVPDEEKDLLKGFPERGGVKERTKSLLQLIRRDLPEQMDEFYGCYNGLNDKTAYELLIDTRHEIAHANPLPELRKLRNKFRKQYSEAKKKRDTLIERIGVNLFEEEDKKKEVLISSKMKKTYSKFVTNLFKDIHLAFFFVEIGLSCLRYLSIIEEIARMKYNI